MPKGERAGTPNEPSQVFRTVYNLRSARAAYLAEARERGVYLHNANADFEALSKAQTPRVTRKIPRRSSSGFHWGDQKELAKADGGWWAVEVELEEGRTERGKRLAPDDDSQQVPKRQKKQLEPESRTKRACKRRRGGRHLQAANGDEAVARKSRLQERSYREGALYQAKAFSMAKHASPTSTGWHGSGPPAWARDAIRERWSKGTIADSVRTFFQVPFANHGSAAFRPSILLDEEGRTFFYRTSPAAWLEPKRECLERAMERLLRRTLDSRAYVKKHSDNLRGPHLPCIMGHYRQYQVAPELTLWHRQNLARAEEFLQEDVLKSIVGWVTSVVELIFPGVARRFKKSADWHEKKYGIRPLFGLFYNLCINACFPGQARIHCAPHADSKNIVGVCVLLIYQTGSRKFNHRRRSWLVIWEAGVVIELPPWVLVAYPSALLFHFNIDLEDFKFVTTAEGEEPMASNSTPMVDGDGDGRGSFVFFNEATMYQSSETNSATLKVAKQKGHSGKVDYGESLQEALENHGTYIDLRSHKRV